MATDIEFQIDKMELNRSGLILNQFDKIRFNFDKNNPTRGGSFIELPKWIQDKKACINIQNEDNQCFKYCIQCGVYKIYEKGHACRMNHYKKIEDSINWDNVKFPSSNIDIDILEENNNGLLSVNVFYTSKELENQDSILLYRKTKVTKATHHINLLKIEDEENDKSHYVFIKDYSRLMGRQITKRQNKVHTCNHCLHNFRDEKTLKAHIEQGCMAVEGQQIKMPNEDETMKFKNHFKKLKAPFVIYADFECLTQRYGTVSTKTLKTDKYQHHRPCGFMINVVNAIDNSTEEFLYRGEDCMDVFTNKLIEVKDKIMAKMEENKEPIKTAKNLEDFKNATHCFICGEKFEKDDVRCYDNCHFTGKYRGCAHQKCNLDYSMRRYKIPVFFHNLKNYDAHLVIEKANDLSENSRIDVIAQNTEKFVTFGFKRLSFKDSFSFLTASLDKLVGLTKYENYDPKKAKEELTMSDEWDKRFKFRKRNPYVDDLDDLDLLTDKGVHPYDYFEQLPPKKAFYSKLTETNISDDEYERAKKIWKHFGIKNLGEYHDLYSRTDVLLLTDIFENFRDLCLEYYKLDPAHYVTLPNFAWDAMLLKTDIEIHPLTDQSMY